MEQSVAHGIKISVKLRSPDEETRRTAVGELGAFPLEEVKEYLAHAMGDSSWRVRKEAVDILLKSSVDEDFLETLVGLLSSGENAGLRNSAVEALERLGEASVPILSRHISDPDPEVRKFVIDILGTIGDVVVVPLLVNALEDPDHNVCAAAAETLGKIADPRGVAPLVEVLKRND